MRNGFFPIFTKGRVLKKESIEYLRDFPHDLAALSYTNYSDGILFGFTIGYTDQKVKISKGAIKHRGNIMIVPETEVDILLYGTELYIKLEIGESEETEDYRICPINVCIDGTAAVEEIELGRFCLKRGAVLRCEYDSFEDLRTTENTLDITKVLYAGTDTATLHPRVMQEYAKAIMKSSTDGTDIAFSLMCLNAQVVQKRVIEWYIAKRTGGENVEYSIDELYEKLSEILPRSVKKERSSRTRGRGPSIIG